MPLHIVWNGGVASPDLDDTRQLHSLHGNPGRDLRSTCERLEQKTIAKSLTGLVRVRSDHPITKWASDTSSERGQGISTDLINTFTSSLTWVHWAGDRSSFGKRLSVDCRKMWEAASSPPSFTYRG